MKNRGVYIGVLLTAMLLSGCASKPVTEVSVTQNAAETETAKQSQADSGRSGQMGGKIGLYGKVKNIVGNSMTIALAELPKQGTRNRGAGSQTGRETEPPQGLPPNATGGNGPNAAGGNSPDAAGGNSPNAAPESGKPPGSGSGTRGGFGLSAAELKLTGETQELLVPVGVPIQSMGTGGVKTIDFADISKGDTISIFYMEDGKTIQRVLISPGSN